MVDDPKNSRDYHRRMLKSTGRISYPPSMFLKTNRGSPGRINSNGMLNPVTPSMNFPSTRTDSPTNSQLSLGYLGSANRPTRVGLENSQVGFPKDLSQFQFYRSHHNGSGMNFHHPHYRDNYFYRNNGNNSPHYMINSPHMGNQYQQNMKSTSSYVNSGRPNINRHLQDFMLLQWKKFYEHISQCDIDELRSQFPNKQSLQRNNSNVAIEPIGSNSPTDRSNLIAHNRRVCTSSTLPTNVSNCYSPRKSNDGSHGNGVHESSSPASSGNYRRRTSCFNHGLSGKHNIGAETSTWQRGQKIVLPNNMSAQASVSSSISSDLIYVTTANGVPFVSTISTISFSPCCILTTQSSIDSTKSVDIINNTSLSITNRSDSNSSIFNQILDDSLLCLDQHPSKSTNCLELYNESVRSERNCDEFFKTDIKPSQFNANSIFLKSSSISTITTTSYTNSIIISGTMEDNNLVVDLSNSLKPSYHFDLNYSSISDNKPVANLSSSVPNDQVGNISENTIVNEQFWTPDSPASPATSSMINHSINCYNESPTNVSCSPQLSIYTPNSEDLQSMDAMCLDREFVENNCPLSARGIIVSNSLGSRTKVDSLNDVD